jgi:hypothetical protein
LASQGALLMAPRGRHSCNPLRGDGTTHGLKGYDLHERKGTSNWIDVAGKEQSLASLVFAFRFRVFRRRHARNNIDRKIHWILLMPQLELTADMCMSRSRIDFILKRSRCNRSLRISVFSMLIHRPANATSASKALAIALTGTLITCVSSIAIASQWYRDTLRLASLTKPCRVRCSTTDLP